MLDIEEVMEIIYDNLSDQLADDQVEDLCKYIKSDLVAYFKDVQ